MLDWVHVFEYGFYFQNCELGIIFLQLRDVETARLAIELECIIERLNG